MGPPAKYKLFHLDLCLWKTQSKKARNARTEFFDPVLSLKTSKTKKMACETKLIVKPIKQGAFLTTRKEESGIRSRSKNFKAT